MKITKTENGTEMTVFIEGRIDTSTAPALEAEIKDKIGDLTALRLDFAGVEYISSAGLRVLLSAQKEMNKHGVMAVANVKDMVMEVFEITGFCDILTIQKA